MSAQKVFGVVNGATREFIDCSNSLHGAKIHATKNGYYTVAVRFINSGHVFTLATKKAGKWQPTQYGIDRSYAGS